MNNKIYEIFVKSTLFIYLLMCCSVSICQVTEVWVKRYNGPANGYDYASSVYIDASGNVYVTGHSTGSGSGLDYYTIKYNSSGVQQWAHRYNAPDDSSDGATAIAVDNAGNVYVTGSSFDSFSDNDYCTIKYNPSGLISWLQTYDGPGSDYDAAETIAIDNSGNVYVAGLSIGSGTNHDFCTIKYNSLGVQQWVKRYNGTANSSDAVESIAVDNSGNVYVTGYVANTGSSDDYCTIKYNSSGVQQWIRIYNGSGNGADFANSIAVDNSGNVYVTGMIDAGISSIDYCTIKYNSAGTQLWLRTYNGPGNSFDNATALVIDISGNIYVTGGSRSGTMDDDYCTLKYNPSGVLQWTARYNSPWSYNEGANSIAVDNSGNVYVTGESEGIGTQVDYCTVKYNSSGVQQWFQRYNGPGNGSDRAYCLAVDNSGNVYVTGKSIGSGTGDDYCTIKYYEPIGIQKISNEIPLTYALYQNYPNPFNPVTKIRFDIPPLEGARGRVVTLIIYDLLCREAATLVNEQLSPGTYEVEFDGGNYASGIYFYKLIAGNYVESKKMILIK